MEMQFHKNEVSCMKCFMQKDEAHEETQEIKLPDTMPDIGRILGTWGLLHVRGKEWRGDAVGIQLGITAWVMYAPEDGTEAKVLETWIPVSIKWNVDDPTVEGAITVFPKIKSLDARVVSARKIMLRSNLSIQLQTLLPCKQDVFDTSTDIPEDIQILRNTYPMELIQEAGEKVFVVEEETSDAAKLPDGTNILYYSMVPEVMEQRVVTDKLLFRGKLKVNVAYGTQEDRYQIYQQEFGFSQYAQLDKEYEPGARAKVYPVLTVSELEITDGKLRMKTEIAAQYHIFDRVMVCAIEDAYSPRRDISVQTHPLELMSCLDSQTDSITLSEIIQIQPSKILDAVFLMGNPVCKYQDDHVEFEISGIFQILYIDEQGVLCSTTVRTQKIYQRSADLQTKTICNLIQQDNPKVTLSGDGVSASVELEMQYTVFSEKPISSAKEISFGDLQDADPNRPSLIVRRMDHRSLWEMAKESGSSVEAILQANGLCEGPMLDQILLIPVL